MVNMARLVGIFTGIAIAISGEGSCFLINGISYLAVIVSLFAMRLEACGGRRNGLPCWCNWRDQGLRLRVCTNSDVFTLFALVDLMGWPFTVLNVPVFASRF